MYKLLLICIAVVCAGYALYSAYTNDSEVAWSRIADDEVVVFFRTAAWLDDEETLWHVPIHGWIYEPQNSTARKDLLAAILEKQYELTPDSHTEANFTRRINLMIADNERGKQIVVSIAGRHYVLPSSGANGQFSTTLAIPAPDLEQTAADGLIRFSAVMRDGDNRTFSGEASLVNRAGLSIISDIDDTVKISNVTERKALLENTFLLDFRAVPGMARLYRDWENAGATLHFVSSSPWQLYSPLREFLDENEFPWSTLSLKQVRFRDETLFNLFKKGTETKPAAIEKIFGQFPDRRFALVGDSGEQDPEVYAALMRKYPQRILKAYIRNVTQESADSERMQLVFDGIERSRWLLFDEPLTLPFPE